MTTRWGSDVVADFLRAAGIPYVALNPGASFRGLHDSLVNHLGDERPSILTCLHEEHAVALAHGYAKVSGSPLAVALHSNVGLMHASMAIYNAWADRVPVFLIGATGPVDAARRRPWIDWIHTAGDQAAIVRPFVKWDDQPASATAMVESLGRAWELCRTPPCAPTYVVLDSAVQEQRLDDALPAPPVAAVVTGAVTDGPWAATPSVCRARELLAGADRPVVLMGRVSRRADDWACRLRLVDHLGARVITDLKAGAAFPTDHPAHVRGPAFFLSEPAVAALGAADVVLSLDWIDLAGTLAQAPAVGPRRVISASQDDRLHNGGTKDHFGWAPVDVRLATAPDVAVRQLLHDWRTARGPATPGPRPEPPPAEPAGPERAPGPITIPLLARSLRTVLGRRPACLVRVPLGWDGDCWPFAHPLDYLGYDGGGGIGSGPGMLVGAALALRGGARLPVGILGDGDFLMGVQALWTAARYRIPLLAVVANNRTYRNDEVHQENVARTRGRDATRKWIGQRIDDPAPDLAGLARAQGLDGIGPVTEPGDLAGALARGVELARGGRAVVVDVVVNQDSAI